MAVIGLGTESVGTFHARAVQEAVSHDRDGNAVFPVRERAEDTVEVLFGDDIWMLSSPVDVMVECGS